MKDKFKGLVVGLLVGSMITGSMAYAANSKTINVIIQDLKFKLDGTAKPSANASGIIYNNSVYVPIKSVSGAIGKPVTYDAKTGTVSIGTSGIAVYQGGTVTQAELDTFLAANAFYYGQVAPADMQLAVKQLIAIKLLAAKSEKALSKEAASTVAASIQQLTDIFGSAETVAGELKTAKLTEAGLKLFIKRQFLAGKTLENMIDSATLQAEYDRARKADSAAFVNASVRHILIATTDNQTGEAIRKDEEALARAKEVLAKLKAGGDFTALAKEYSDDPGSKDKGGLYAEAPLTGYVEPFKKAGAELPLNQISDPVKTDYGYHVMRVESRNVLTVEKAKDQLLPGLLNQAFQKYIDNEVPKLIKSINVTNK
ncbi:peptidylprolyl isomerase [Cohnella herbarum]|uniref:Peptidylprolyl isomerase n=1 Tax=Cohnella herbarum TaxID=2728023 RepID=A0A7Z2VFT8_9BACL|nr:peptidylprolyl isomerase [Cohnella herbarum]QJD82094.1 peptidylprolyl isomerase [Cohnella herbarum]